MNGEDWLLVADEWEDLSVFKSNRWHVEAFRGFGILLCFLQSNRQLAQGALSCRLLIHQILENNGLEVFACSQTKSHHPTTFWWSARMWRVVNTGCQTSMCSLKNLQATNYGHRRNRDPVFEREGGFNLEIVVRRWTHI